MRTLCVFLFVMATTSHAADCATVQSGPNTAALVELYTSEGCDSCPPADRWLSSSFAASPGSKLVVPVAFHVDYWDYLGWKDPYGDARFSDRQRTLARASGARAVYTPQVTVAGRDHSWRGGGTSKVLEAVNAKPAAARIEIAPSSVNARVKAALEKGVRPDDLALLVAVTQNGLSTAVKAGENRGATLRHDFVVRELQSQRFGSAGSIDARFDFTPRPDWKADHMNIVAFVQNVRTGEVLQALAAPACR